MILLLQRVLDASVKIENKVHGEIGHGLLVFFCAEDGDSEEKIEYVVDKTINLRIFEDENGKMNLSLKDVGGELLVVSQFTLYGDCRKGKRPSFTNAARPEVATPLYEEFVQKSKDQDIVVQTGQFGAHMMVDLINDGPVTMLLDSSKNF